MKVLHLPYNVGSQISVTVRALQDIGVEARGLVSDNSPILGSDGIDTYEIMSGGRLFIRRGLQTFHLWREVLGAIRWADVVHWHFCTRILPKNLDLKYTAFLNKARLVEFWGSDIRIPEIESHGNPYIARVFEDNPNYAHWLRENSLKTQDRFARHGFKCLIPGYTLWRHLQRDLFPNYYKTRQRILLSDFQTSYPDPQKKRPLIVHSPSKKEIKGTNAVLRVVEQLKRRYEFDFELINGVEHSKALQIVSSCDIMLDQFVIGAHGLAALEAMAFGKPTVCYIKSSLVQEYPDDLPIVNANQDNLAEVVKSLLENGKRRYEIGRRSRAYVEKYHDAHKIARELVAIYKELLDKVRTD